MSRVQLDRKKHVGNDAEAKVEFKEETGALPEVKDVLADIDRLLRETKLKARSGCGCG